jgi:hypothetical protein
MALTQKMQKLGDIFIDILCKIYLSCKQTRDHIFICWEIYQQLECL